MNVYIFVLGVGFLFFISSLILVATNSIALGGMSFVAALYLIRESANHLQEYHHGSS